MASSQDQLAAVIAKQKALRARELKIQQRIKKEKDPAKREALTKRLNSVREQRKAGKGNRKNLQDKVNIEGVTGANNLAAANSLAEQWTPKLDMVDTGVLGVDPVTGNPIRNEENTRMLKKFESIMENGLEAPEYQAEREQMSKGLDSDYRTSQAELAKAQARSKVFGAAGAAQQANLARADSEKRADVEQQLMLKGTELKRQGLKDWSGALAGRQDFEMQGQKVNLGQKNAMAEANLALKTNMLGAGMNKDYQNDIIKLSNKALDAAGEPIEFPDVNTGTKEPDKVGGSTGGTTSEGFPVTKPLPDMKPSGGGGINKDAKTIATLRARLKRLRQNSLSKGK